MTIQGHVQNGVVVLDGSASLPEGAVVAVTYPVRETSAVPVAKKPVEFPLVRSAKPGSFHLTNQRIHEILEEEEIEALRKQGNVSS